MATKRGSHCVYDTKYHLVWAPKHRKWILRGEIKDRTKGLSEKVAGHQEQLQLF
ncbi:hypothetical protein D4R47_02570 [archaeon]|nr:MAG: hypothetical protein D4R47_02570 [archaeon]